MITLRSPSQRYISWSFIEPCLVMETYHQSPPRLLDKYPSISPSGKVLASTLNSQESFATASTSFSWPSHLSPAFGYGNEATKSRRPYLDKGDIHYVPSDFPDPPNETRDNLAIKRNHAIRARNRQLVSSEHKTSVKEYSIETQATSSTTTSTTTTVHNEVMPKRLINRATPSTPAKKNKLRSKRKWLFERDRKCQFVVRRKRSLKYAPIVDTIPKSVAAIDMIDLPGFDESLIQLLPSHLRQYIIRNPACPFPKLIAVNTVNTLAYSRLCHHRHSRSRQNSIRKSKPSTVNELVYKKYRAAVFESKCGKLPSFSNLFPGERSWILKEDQIQMQIWIALEVLLRRTLAEKMAYRLNISIHAEDRLINI